MRKLLVALLLSLSAQADPRLHGRWEEDAQGQIHLLLEVEGARGMHLVTPIDPKLVHQVDQTHIMIDIPLGLPLFPGLLFDVDGELHYTKQLNFQELTNRPELGGPKP